MSTQYLTGVLQTGAPRAPGVPFDARHGLQVVQGETLTLIMRVLTSAGVPVPASGRAFQLTIKKNPRDIVNLTTLSGSARADLGPEFVQFSMSPSSTVTRRPGTLCYDIWTRQASTGQRDCLVPTSPLYLSASAGFGLLE
jgi:hypothetical protein